ncbi:MAG: vWA domain-containing protein [Planctomycetota bacterium]|jgi:hypothetical protein
MKRTTILIGVLCLAAAPAAARDKVVPVRPPAQPQVEVAFVMDTTGSMSGLIAGAKAKIWQIANHILTGKPRPKVRIALVPYRDKGDQYVTRVYDLSDNIDKVYQDLMTFTAAGGGDGPENVNQALHDAVHKISWSKGRRTLKIIYLVGDWPPHNEYKDVPTYDKIAHQAITKGIYVNTVLCGTNGTARRIWIEIARAAEGTFVAIDQGGGVKEIPTPYDAELAKLNASLNETVLIYGARPRRRGLMKMAKLSTSMPASAQAERVAYALRAGKAATGDLVDAVRKKDVDLSKVEEDKLPEPMQKMTPEQRKQHVGQLQAKRDAVYKQIKDLTVKREAFLKNKRAETAGAKDGFDAQVMEGLKVQAAKMGITYK